MPTKIHLRKLPSHRDHRSNNNNDHNPPSPFSASFPSLQHQQQQQHEQRDRPSFFPTSTSILQMSARSSTDDNNNINNSNSNNMERKVDDIRGSPRLTGYIFNMIAAAVMIISNLE
jgi:hypothetical protein